MSPSGYAYAVARIRTLETTLVSPADVERIVRADETTLSGILEEAGLVPEGTDAGIARELDEALERGLDETLALLRSMVPDPALFDLLALSKDVLSLELFLKGKTEGVDLDRLAPAAGGVVPPETIRQCVANDQLWLLPEPLKEMAQEVVPKSERAEDPLAAIGHGLAHRYLVHALEVTRKAGDPWFIAWAVRQIDLFNLESFLRARATGLSRNEWERAAVPGGEIPLIDFRNIWNEPLEAAVEAFQFGPYGAIVASGVAGWQEHGDLVDWERARADFDLRCLEETKYETFSAGPLLLFWLRRKAEVRLARAAAVARRLARSREGTSRMVVRTDA